MEKKSLNTIKGLILDFNKKRGWKQEPVDLVKSIIIEAAELLEHYQWDESDKIEKGIKKKNIKELELEVADILWYIILFCHKIEIDIIKALERRIIYNEKKYPEEMFNGKHNEEFYMKQKKLYRTKKH